MVTKRFTGIIWCWCEQHDCTARHSLVTDAEQPILCPYCEEVVGTGLDFGDKQPKRAVHMARVSLGYDKEKRSSMFVED